MTRDEQIRALRQMTSGRASRVSAWLVGGLLAIALVCLVSAPLLREPFFAFAGVFSLLAAYCLHESEAHFRRAALGLERGDARPVQLTVTRTEWSESVDWHATVMPEGAAGWRMDFVPFCWTPHLGTAPARALFLNEVEWPVLVIAAEGILYPRYRPQELGNRSGKKMPRR